MSSRYRVDYALKEHRRDELIQWIKSLLATPFVLYAVKPAGTISEVEEVMISSEAKRRYAEVFSDVEKLINNHIAMTAAGVPEMSRLKQLVPSVGRFFTPLPLEKAFYIEDNRRGISHRRMVSPSFNDIRLILNTAQILELAATFQNDLKDTSIHMEESYVGTETEKLKLITFDGDITLYPDGSNLTSDSKLVGLLIGLLSKGLCVGIVTAAGYIEPEKYYERLHGLIDAINNNDTLTDEQKEHLLVVGGEANYLFRYDCSLQMLKHLSREDWLLPDMKEWEDEDITQVLDFAENKFNQFVRKLNLNARSLRKERAVGLIPKTTKPLLREMLEEVVLRVDKDLHRFAPAQRIRWCAFNGGADVWVDVGDKAYGVKILQGYLTNNLKTSVGAPNTLHVGDQFASIGANDYASRTAAATAWVSSPQETATLLSDLLSYLDDWATY